MNDRLDRNEIISLLETLGSENDEEALAAARVLDTKIAAAGTNWDALLASEAAPDEESEAVATGDDPAEAVESLADSPQDEAGKNAQSLALIAKLLARQGTSKEFRQELEDYKTDIAAGEFKDKDHGYIRALYKRLSA